jgi:ataxia telangiectasia mutated family protein
LEEPDGFYGISNYNSTESLVRKYRHEQRFNSAFEMDGAAFEAAAQRSAADITKSLSSFGFAHLAMQLNNASGGSTTTLPTDLTYNLAWRTESWDLPIASKKSATSLGSASQSVFNVLKAIHQSRDLEHASKVLDTALSQQVLRTASHVSVENPTVKPENLETLLVLQECKGWLSAQRGSDSDSRALPPSFAHVANSIP